jgi:hypothetical protein
MAIRQFNGQLNQNAVLGALFNMIISQEVFSKNIVLKGTLVEKFRTEGTMYGDTKLYISTDIGTVYDFGDPNSGNLLSKKPPLAPKTQAISIDTFKQTGVTVDGVKLKQAFMSADIYGSFVGVIVQWLRDAMKVLNVTLINTYVGTVETNATRATVEVELPVAPTTTIVERQAYENYMGQIVGKTIADVCVDLEDPNRAFNDYGFLRSYSLEDFIIVWNSKWANRIKHISLPMIFNKDGVIGKELENNTLNSRYFGTVYTTAGTSKAGDRTMVDMVIAGKQYFSGDELPVGTAYKANEAYVVDENVICKIVHKKAIPFMSALMVQTEFYNAKDLDRNHYLTWGYSKPQYLAEFPIINFVAVSEEE